MDAVDVVRRLGTGSDGVAAQREVLRGGVTRHAVRRALAEGRLVALQPGALVVPPLPARGTWLLDAGVVDARYRAEVRAAVVSSGASVRLRARTALLLARVPLLVEPHDVELVVPHGGSRARRVGVDLRLTRRPLDRLRLTHGDDRPLPVVDLLVAVRQVAAERPLVEAVVALDGLLRSGLLARGAVEDAVRAGALGDRLGRLVAARSDAQAGSVLETVARLLLLKHGCGGFRTQVHVRPGTVLRVDFAWERERLVVEVDGQRYHADRRRQDQARDNLVAAVGYRVMRFDWEDVVGQPGVVVRLVREALGR